MSYQPLETKKVFDKLVEVKVQIQRQTEALEALKQKKDDLEELLEAIKRHDESFSRLQGLANAAGFEVRPPADQGAKTGLDSSQVTAPLRTSGDRDFDTYGIASWTK